MSPAMIVQGKPNPYFNQKIKIFGYYAIFYICTNITMKYRSLPAIYLSKSNEHGGHYLMNLYIGNSLHSYEWEEIHIDDYASPYLL